ncbi:prefoldin subunit alpha [Candidatus Woesearchaeota archaeon]|jgi:prefoldin alpha subunit|nr:prefoldin subunit alpha [Candidatus Woesearchaeota archaeon]
MNQQEYQQLVEEINYYQDLLNQVEASLNNLKKTREDLEEFKKEQSKQVLAPIATGVYVEAELKNKDLFVNVGSGIVSKKSVDEAIDIINRQEQEILVDQDKVIKKIEECYGFLQKKGD